MTLREMLDDLAYQWHSSDYFISHDNYVNVPASNAAFRPTFYGLLLCMEGWLDLKINAEPVHVESFCFFAGGPEMVFQRTVQSPDLKINSIFFTKEWLLQNVINVHQLESFYFFSGKTSACLRLSKADAEPLIQLWDVLRNKRSENDNAFHVDIIRNLFFAYLYEAATIYEQKGEMVPQKIARENDLTRQFHQLVAKHCTTQHNLKFYANSLFISSQYLIHAIKKGTGRTPGELIDESRIGIAKQRLNDPQATIADIAEELQFSDQAAFTKFFKRHTGLTPLKYRKEA